VRLHFDELVDSSGAIPADCGLTAWSDVACAVEGDAPGTVAGVLVLFLDTTNITTATAPIAAKASITLRFAPPLGFAVAPREATTSSVAGLSTRTTGLEGV
jgi:hypothetical protein